MPFQPHSVVAERLAGARNGGRFQMRGMPAAKRRKALTLQHGVAANRKAALKLVAADGEQSLAARQAGSEFDGETPGRLEALPPEERSREILKTILQELDDDKAEGVVTIPLAGKSDIADAMVIASGRSQRHVGAMADKTLRRLKDAGFGRARVEGMPACDWVLIDAEDVIVHLFRPEVRDFYNLERIWSETARAPSAPEA